VGALFLPWSTANAQAIAAGERDFTVALGDASWRQEPQKYHAKSLAALKARYAAADPNRELSEILTATDCAPWLS
jgi:hypothetical protein